MLDHDLAAEDELLAPRRVCADVIDEPVRRDKTAMLANLHVPRRKASRASPELCKQTSSLAVLHGDRINRKQVRS